MWTRIVLKPWWAYFAHCGSRADGGVTVEAIRSGVDLSYVDADAGPTMPAQRRGLRWVFVGPQGVRAGWSVLLFLALMIAFVAVGRSAVIALHLLHNKTFASRAIFFELFVFLLPLIGAAAVVGLVAHRRILDYNLRGPRRAGHFCFGAAAGFVALSALVAVLAAGGWLHFGPVALYGAAILRFGALWGCAFLLVACFEEGLFRCYLQFTLTRGLNFWWAASIVGAACLAAELAAKGSAAGGVYLIALLGLPPCLLLHLKRAPGAGFWQAAWVTSTLFGIFHVSNPGENWIGIFQAAGIGFTFCVSIWATGSAWWAIGCHAAWDWAQTFFYGTADSGVVAQGHLLTTTPAGSAFWSGGADGPEGSPLALGVIPLLLIVLVVYGNRRRASQTPGQAQLLAVDRHGPRAGSAEAELASMPIPGPSDRDAPLGPRRGGDRQAGTVDPARDGPGS
jgi:uncharacterized protein